MTNFCLLPIAFCLKNVFLHHITIMTIEEHIILIYLAIITVVTFFAYGIDKWKAQHNRWRIPESRAFGIGGHWRQCRGVVGDAGLASQDPAQEVQVRRAGDIRGAGGVGGVVAVEIMPYSQQKMRRIELFFTAPTPHSCHRSSAPTP